MVEWRGRLELIKQKDWVLIVFSIDWELQLVIEMSFWAIGAQFIPKARG